MGDRRMAREVAVQALYEIEQSQVHPKEALQSNLERRKRLENASVHAYAKQLLQAVLSHRDEIQKRISAVLTNWSLDRVALVDRCVLETGAAELVYFPEVPVSVVIDEAVEIARTFSSEESAAFVNGVLDRIAKGLSPTGLPAEADS